MSTRNRSVLVAPKLPASMAKIEPAMPHSAPEIAQVTVTTWSVRMPELRARDGFAAVALIALPSRRYSRLGTALRATAANPSLARNSGIRTDQVVTVTWAISGALCGIAGSIFAIDAGSFGATSTDLFLVLILAAVFLGGPGQAYGAMLGAAIIGLSTEVGAAYITPAYKDVIAFVLLLGMLALRPTGLLGNRT